MSDGAPPAAACPNCGRIRPAETLDARGWCPQCRAAVVRRARTVAIAAGALAALGVLALVVALISPTLRIPVVVWLVAAAAVYYVVYRLAQRVAFEVIRGRGVPPPPDDDGR